MTTLIGFSDAATFADGAGFQLWTPQPVAIRRFKVFHCAERAREFQEFGGSVARHCYLLETAGSGGSQLDVWLRVVEGYKHEPVGAAGWLDGAAWGGPMMPLRWSPSDGLAAPELLAWAADVFGQRHALKVRAELAAMCARLWAEPR